MTRNAEAVLRDAMALSEAERAEVADALIRSLEPPADAQVEEAWREEVRSRVEALEAGELGTVPWSEVRERLYARLRADQG